MAIKTWSELQDDLKTLLDDRSDDNSLNFAENFSDTLEDFRKNEVDWKQKYETNDKEWQEKYKNIDEMWRQKYKDRFFNKSLDFDEGSLEPPCSKPEPKKPTKYEDLFTYL